MRSLLISLLSAASLSAVSALPWPAGFKYPTSFVSKYSPMLKNVDGTYRIDPTEINVIKMDLATERQLSYSETNLTRSTYEETKKGRKVTIDWDKNKCTDDAKFPSSNLTEYFDMLNDPIFNIYNGIVEIDVEGKGRYESFHQFVRGWASTGIYMDHFTVDTRELRYIYFSFRNRRVNTERWQYYYPGYGYRATAFDESDWEMFDHCPSFE